MYLLYGFLCLLGAILFYIVYRWWLVGREDQDTYPKEMTRLGKVKMWVYCALLLLISISFFIKACN